MSKILQTIVLASALIGGLVATSPVYAADTPSSAAKSSDMMGGDMMGMMKQMNQMMETCNKMMQSSMDGDHGSGRPNEQPQKGAPAEPEKKS